MHSRIPWPQTEPSDLCLQLLGQPSSPVVADLLATVFQASGVAVSVAPNINRTTTGKERYAILY